MIEMALVILVACIVVCVAVVVVILMDDDKEGEGKKFLIKKEWHGNDYNNSDYIDF
jgi:hypothetical protein